MNLLRTTIFLCEWYQRFLRKDLARCKLKLKMIHNVRLKYMYGVCRTIVLAAHKGMMRESESAQYQERAWYKEKSNVLQPSPPEQISSAPFPPPPPPQSRPFISNKYEMCNAHGRTSCVWTVDNRGCTPNVLKTAVRTTKHIQYAAGLVPLRGAWWSITCTSSMFKM